MEQLRDLLTQIRDLLYFEASPESKSHNDLSRHALRAMESGAPGRPFLVLQAMPVGGEEAGWRISTEQLARACEKELGEQPLRTRIGLAIRSESPNDRLGFTWSIEAHPSGYIQGVFQLNENILDPAMINTPHFEFMNRFSRVVDHLRRDVPCEQDLLLRWHCFNALSASFLSREAPADHLPLLTTKIPPEDNLERWADRAILHLVQFFGRESVPSSLWQSPKSKPENKRGE